MKNGWQRRRLSKFVERVSTGPFGSMLHKSDYVRDGVPLVNPINIVRERIVPDPTKLIDAVTKGRLSTYVLEEGDVVVARRGEIGRCAVIGPREVGWVCGTGCFFIRPLPSVDSQFLAYLIRSDGYREKLEQASTGTTMSNLSNTALGGLVIDLPPLPEQQRIVGILDEAFAGIATAKANADKNLQNARAIFVSHLQSVFSRRGEGWVQCSLGDIAQVKGGKRVPKGYKLLTEQTDHPYLRVTEFTDTGTIDTSDLRYVSAAVYREIKRYVIYSTDLYISIAGTIGKTGIIPEELDGANLTENACRLVFNPNINNRYVYYFTVTPDFIAQAGLNTRTAAQPKLALSRLATIKLGIPALAEQVRLVAEFDALREETQRLESLYQRKLAALDALKQSLLHQAFSGQI